ncbi:DNA polymerase III subunit epsilon [Corynebacterium halotolerans]|uniref:DNA polymerase III subunit epsilon n=1 Tax=Corynebacterium halotolerans YIM 70093 = DSM 44683 TaxID=1121362 RepID=M1P3R5_9CORY|nr:DNA polymerase III subunit epsilon [Corynebacterium halotolerans]AGF71321.1 DNA polymerase III subunit epsilon [Corynebacterium halotolerans YIM 70093 = DSM 44683]
MITTNGPQDEAVPGTAPADTDSVAAADAPSDDSSDSNSTADSANAKRRREQDAARRAEVEAHPFVAVSVQSTGIHPSTGRLVAVDVVTFDDDGETGEEFHAVLNPGSDPGPRHYHGLSREEIEAGQRFPQVLKTLGRLIDDRTLVVHDGPLTWGFIVSEARRAMNAAARSNRSRGRGRGRGRRRRQRVGHVPRPARIVDTLASTRRQGLPLDDTRLADVARALGLDAPSPVASVERAGRPEAETTRETTLLLIDVFLTERTLGTMSVREPGELRADRFGLQRSHVRVDAVEAPRPHPNPGTWTPGKPLARGMEVVVAPEVQMDPNDLIAACMRAGLAYSEKLTRQTSVVVCNKTTELRGKAMHADRKGIPLVSDDEFMAAVARVKDDGAA